MDNAYSIEGSLELETSKFEVSDNVLELNGSGKAPVLVNRVDNLFNEALQELKEQTAVALGTAGAELGRKCKLPLLVMATPQQIYIFDIQAMQEQAFRGGLKALLESSRTQKIVHDSRRISDCLRHKHGVELDNIFDTQVADIIIQKNKLGYLPNDMKTLQECVAEYMGLPDKPISEKVDIVEWSQRPMSRNVKENATENVGHLHKLSQVLQEEMMSPFRRGVRCFLDVQRCSGDLEAWSLSSQNKKLPREFARALRYD